MGRLSIYQPLIVFIGQQDRAHIGAITAGCAFRLVYIARCLVNSDLEISLFAFNPVDLCIGDEVDVEMPADLDQFRRDNSHGAVIGGECLVQFGHHTAYGGTFFK